MIHKEDINSGIYLKNMLESEKNKVSLLDKNKKKQQDILRRNKNSGLNKNDQQNKTTTSNIKSILTIKNDLQKGSNWATPPIKRVDQNNQIGSFNSLSSPQRFLTTRKQINTVSQESFLNSTVEENINCTQLPKENNFKSNQRTTSGNQKHNQSTHILADPEKIHKTIEKFLDEQNQFTKYYLEPLKESELITKHQFIRLFSSAIQIMENQGKILEKLKKVVGIITESKKQNKSQHNIYTPALYCKIFDCFSTIRLSLFEKCMVNVEENLLKLENLIKNSTKIMELFSEASKNLSGHKFNYYYIKPLKLVCEYRKYFAELKKYFTKVHSSFYLTKITRISQGFTNLSKIVQPKLVTYLHLNDLNVLTINLLKDQQFKLNENDRTLLFVDQVYSPKKKKVYKLFLFTDILLFASITKNGQLLPQQPIPLKNVTIQDENDNQQLNLKNAIKVVVSNDETINSFVFHNAEKKSFFFHILRSSGNIIKVKIIK
ncbi:pleckstrin homology domain-containing family f member [Anaeramoeba flamelloides]|uniref:Pleckstrin homology domain-containing family f member n=1 Tax=Anaeramoeba flamelloides TaxID=1746091 RepID=A0AAV7Z4Q0_9EUKA|nr:pleckstrin homology domain-containing family f member [Anaeramoeba flamelloides]